MAPTLYYLPGSPPVRAVLMFAKSIDLKLNLKEINLFKKEHLTPEYLKINPQHTIPTLVEEDGFILWDSHSILTYLVSKYGKNDALYPKDLKKRAIIDQRLHFESGVVFALLRQIVGPILFGVKTSVSAEDKENLDKVWGFLEAFLDSHKWVAGDFISVADYSLVSSVSTLNSFVPVDDKRFPKLADWLKRAETSLPGYEENVPGLETIKQLLLSKLK